MTLNVCSWTIPIAEPEMLKQIKIISPLFIGGLLVVIIVGVTALAISSVRVSRDIDRAAATTGSSTIPKDPGSNMDRTTRTTKEDGLARDTNVPAPSK